MSRSLSGRFGVVAICVAAVGGLGALFATRVSNAMRRRAEATQPVRLTVPVVAVEPIGTHDLERVVEFTGTIRPRNRVDIFARASGRIEQVMAHTGDRVHVGQLLVVVDHRAVAWQNTQALAQIAAATAGVEQARVARDAAERDANRFRALRATQSATQADVERSETQLRNADALLRSAEAQQSVARASAGLAGVSLGDSRIVSPIDGTVTRSAVDIGAEVTPGVSFMEIQDVATLRMQGAVPASEFLRLHVGQPVEVSVDTLTQPVAGVVATLSPSLDAATRRAAVEVTIANPDTALLPNMFATVRVAVGRQTGVLAIPAGAVVDTGVGRGVFVYRDGHAYERHPQFGVQVGDLLPVSDMTAGELLIVSGQVGLSDQARVDVAHGDGSMREGVR